MKKIPFLILFLFLARFVYESMPVSRIWYQIQKPDVYFPQHAIGNGKAWYLKSKLDSCFSHYRPANGFYFCNVFARDILDHRFVDVCRGRYGFYFEDFDYDVSVLFQEAKDIVNISISKAFDQALVLAKYGLLFAVSAEEAQQKANLGEIVWVTSKWLNHECLVYPGEWDPALGFLVAQAGKFNGVFRVSDNRVYGKYWNDSKIIRCYVFSRLNRWKWADFVF